MQPKNQLILWLVVVEEVSCMVNQLSSFVFLSARKRMCFTIRQLDEFIVEITLSVTDYIHSQIFRYKRSCVFGILNPRVGFFFFNRKVFVNSLIFIFFIPISILNYLPPFYWMIKNGFINSCFGCI